MIPALLAVPVVEGVVGGVMGSVAHLFSPSSPSAPTGPTSASAPTFTPYLNNASATTAAPVSTSASPTGTMRADEWGQLAPTDLQTWMQGLAGKHVTATDETGRTISGMASVQQIGHTQALNIGGQLVSLSQLKQISWSPSVA